MADVGNFKDLIVWQKSIKQVKQVYLLTQSFPADEKFEIVSQMRRAAVSIPSNIAEGQARRTTGDYVRFVSNAEGSLAELETQFVIAIELAYCKQSDVSEAFGLMTEGSQNAQCASVNSFEQGERKKIGIFLLRPSSLFTRP